MQPPAQGATLSIVDQGAQPSPAQAPALIGQRIANYRVVALRGQGGMGAVYEAVHEQLGRRAAIKVLLPELSRDQEMVGRFFNEARAVNIVGHPGIVNIYELGQLPNGMVYIIMEYLEGETLAARLEQLASCPLRDVLRLCRQVASALAAAHNKGIIHRDLKPDNIMIVRDPDMPGGERTKILDFGVAKVAEAHAEPTSLRTRTGIVMGTPRYMAPEQCRGAGGITDRADVYSLGVMLYQLLAGRPPFEAEALGDLLVQQIHEPPPPLRRLKPEVPEAVARLVHAMLAKNPAERPCMAQVAAELERLEGEAVAFGRGGEPSLPVTPSMFLHDADAVPATPRRAPPEGQGPAEQRADLPPPGVLRQGRRAGRALLALGLLLVVGAGLYGLRLGMRPAPPPPAPPVHRDGEAALLLLAADGDLQARRWAEALAKAEQVLALPDLSGPTRQMAAERREHAERERKAQDTFQRFHAALKAQDLDQAMQLYHQIPPASVYRPEAKPHYERAFPAFASAHLSKARAARRAGRCEEARAQLALVLAIEPEYRVARREQEQPCGQQEDEDEDEDEEEPEQAPALPRVAEPE
ncbi:MAG: serine/threonine protein kinase [Myxococcota bacterium]|nr:serine/threonine protein kinase [Myxococcota bacterium]